MKTKFAIMSEFDGIMEDLYNKADDLENLQKALDDISIEAEDKLAACFHVINKLQSEAAEADTIINNATTYKKQKLAAIEKLEDDMKLMMEFMSIQKVDRPDCRITLTKPREVVQVIDESKIPADFLRIVPETKAPDKKAILEALKAGKEIAGCSLGLGNPGLKYPKLKGE